jgi:probable F420-dependent oxidoreductase
MDLLKGLRFTFTHPMHSHPYNPEVASGQGIVDLAVAAEKAGFDGFGFTDHPAPSHRWLENGGHDALDPFVAMSFAAAHTTNLRLIPNILVLPYRNPFVVAKAAASLDLLSEGRFTLAVGVGYLKKEFTALGIDFEQRAALFDESLAAIRAIWTTDDLRFEGRNFTAGGITAHPRPATEPYPPIWIGGNTAAARRRVAEHGDGWCPFQAPAGLAQTARTAALESLEQLTEGIADLRRRLEAADRDPYEVDIAFSPFLPGGPGDDDFNADAYLDELQKLAETGVTWVQVIIPGDSMSHALEAVDRFRSTVIEQL